MFTKQFFGKTAWMTVAVVAAVHAIAVPLLHANTASLVALAVVAAATACVSWRSLSTGLLVAFAEIFVGGHGHLIQATVGGFGVSIRIAIFVAVMLVFAIRLLQRRVTPQFVLFRDASFLLLAAAVVIGTVVGFVRNDAGNAFDDMNSYLTIAYLLPLVSVAWDQALKRNLLQVLTGSVAWIAVSTLALVFLFTHLPGKALHEVYAFVRDSRLAEVTLLSGPEWFVSLLPASSPWYFRVFEPAHFFVLVLGALLVAARFVLWRGQRMPTGAKALLVLCAATFVASLSRSFVIGLLGGGAVLLITLAIESRGHLFRTVRQGMGIIALTVLGAVVFWAVIAMPVPSHPDLRDAAFYQEKTDDTRELAVSSRWNLLRPMFTAIMEHPIIGNGFGREVTFVSDDPRVRDINPSGEWTTYRFEWGYQDIWLKMGLLGLVAFIAYAIALTDAFLFTVRTHDNRWLAIGMYVGVVALFATHLFSPYLNHPIGIGMILFVLPFFDWKGTRDAIAAKEKARVKLWYNPRHEPVRTSNTESILATSREA